MIPEDLVTFLESGNSIHIATRDKHLEPYGTRLAAITVDSDRQHLTGYLPASDSRRILANLRANGQASFGISRPSDHHSCQIKGVFVRSRRCSPRERAIIRRQVEGYARDLQAIGVPGEVVLGWSSWPCVAVTIRVTDLFSQTPGPGAGARMP